MRQHVYAFQKKSTCGSCSFFAVHVSSTGLICLSFTNHNVQAYCHLMLYDVQFVVDGTDSFAVAFDQVQAAGKGEEGNYR